MNQDPGHFDPYRPDPHNTPPHPYGTTNWPTGNDPHHGPPPTPVPIIGPGYPPHAAPLPPPVPSFPAGPLHAQPQAPRRRRSRTVPVVVGVIAVVLLLGGGAVLSAAFHVGPAANLLADSGVESCKAIAAQRSANNPNSTSGPVGKSTEADYRKARALFTNSRYADLRTAGAHLLDLVWQMQASLGNGPDAGFGALVFVGPLLSAWSDLAGACANHGVVLPPLTTG